MLYLKKCSGIEFLPFVSRAPQSLSVGGGSLSFPLCVGLLLNSDTLRDGPVHVTLHSVGPSSAALVAVQFVGACLAVVIVANWVEAVGVAIGAHVAKRLHLGFATCSTTVATVLATGVWVDIFAVLFRAALLRRVFCNGVGQGLDLRRHCFELGVRCLGVGYMVTVGCRCAHNLGNVVTDFIATVCELICRLVLVVAGCAATRVLFVGVGGLDKIFKICLGVCVV